MNNQVEYVCLRRVEDEIADDLVVIKDLARHLFEYRDDYILATFNDNGSQEKKNNDFYLLLLPLNARHNRLDRLVAHIDCKLHHFHLEKEHKDNDVQGSVPNYQHVDLVMHQKVIFLFLPTDNQIAHTDKANRREQYDEVGPHDPFSKAKHLTTVPLLYDPHANRIDC